MARARLTVALVMAALIAASAMGQGVDSRTAAGQLAVSGGAAAWRAAGYIAFEVRIQTAAGQLGPWSYHWARKEGLLRMTGPGPGGDAYDLAIELGSRSGGAWANGKQLGGKQLADAMTWALQRFGEDTLWLTFPLEWGAPAVTVTPMSDETDANGTTFKVTEVRSQGRSWKVTLDPTTGLVAKTVLEVTGSPRWSVTWEDWTTVGGLVFASKRTIAETGEVVLVDVKQVAATAPTDLF